MQMNPERENLDGAKIYVNGTLKELKAERIQIDLKDYATYSGSLQSGFGGQFITIPLSGLQAKSLLTNISNMLSVNIHWWSTGWRTNYPNGRVYFDSYGDKLTIILGTNWVSSTTEIALMILGT